MADDERGFFKRGQKPKVEEVVVETAMEAVEKYPSMKAVNVEEPLDLSVVDVKASLEVTPIHDTHYESPVEEKIHALVEAANIPKVEGWENDMTKAPTDGSRVMISEDGVGKGVLVFWRISKFVDRKNLRYVAKGRWTDFLSKIDVTFVPKYWKLYNAEEYWPLQETK